MVGVKGKTTVNRSSLNMGLLGEGEPMTRYYGVVGSPEGKGEQSEIGQGNGIHN